MSLNIWSIVATLLHDLVLMMEATDCKKEQEESVLVPNSDIKSNRRRETE